jgi:hypothetical protein
MRAAFGIVSLLVALAIVALLAGRQLKGVSPVPAAPISASMPMPVANVRESSQQIQDRVSEELNRAQRQGAARLDEADK